MTAGPSDLWRKLECISERPKADMMIMLAATAVAVRLGRGILLPLH